MTYDPNQPRNELGEWTSGAAAARASAAAESVLDSMGGSVSPGHAAALGYYQQAGHVFINRTLRGQDHLTYAGTGTPESHIKKRRAENEAHAKVIDAAIRRSPPLPNDVTVFRGSAQGLAVKPGSTVRDKGFVSTSASPKVAKKFSKASHDTGGGKGGGATLFRIKVPKGKRGLWMPKLGGSYANEKEFLLPRGSKFKVTRVTKSDGVRYVDMELR